MMASCRSTRIITNDVVESQVIQRSCEPTLPPEEKMNWSAVSSYLLDAEDGTQVSFGDIFTDSCAIVIFIRVCYITSLSLANSISSLIFSIDQLLFLASVMLRNERIRRGLIKITKRPTQSPQSKISGYRLLPSRVPKGNLY